MTIQAARQKMGITQKDLAAVMGGEGFNFNFLFYFL